MLHVVDASPVGAAQAGSACPGCGATGPMCGCLYGAIVLPPGEPLPVFGPEELAALAALAAGGLVPPLAGAGAARAA